MAYLAIMLPHKDSIKYNSIAHAAAVLSFFAGPLLASIILLVTTDYSVIFWLAAVQSLFGVIFSFAYLYGQQTKILKFCHSFYFCVVLFVCLFLFCFMVLRFCVTQLFCTSVLYKFFCCFFCFLFLQSHPFIAHI